MSSKTEWQKLEALFHASPSMPAQLSDQTALGILPYLNRIRPEVLAAASRVDNDGDRDLHYRFMLMLAEIDSLREMCGEDV